MSNDDQVILPSRRALRESGMTGQITIPDTPPQTRRERKMREKLAATGVIPPQPTVSEQPAAESAVVEPVESAPAAMPVAPAAPIAEPEPTPALVEPPAAPPVTPAPPPAQVVPATPQVAPTPAEAPAEPVAPRPLTRRELREQLRQPATDAIEQPAVTEPPVEVPTEVTTEAVVEPAPVAASSVTDDEFTWQPVVEDEPEDEAPEAPAEEAQEPPAERPLPPVFAPVESKDTATAPARGVQTAAPATNALILPVAPPVDVTGPLGDTGEILVTGNIPLPTLMAETGLTGVVDAEIDDDDYSDYVDPDSGTYTQPIRAAEAVSSRSLEIDQPLIYKPRWGASALILGISAGLLGVTAAALIAIALLTDLIAL